MPLLRDVDVRDVRLRHHEHARSPAERLVDPLAHGVAIVAEGLGTRLARQHRVVLHVIARQRAEHALEGARRFRRRPQGRRGRAVAAVRMKHRVLVAETLAEVAAVANRARFFREHERQERQIAGEAKHRRVVPEQARVRSPQIVVALVEQRDVVVQVRVVHERLAERPRAFLDEAEIHDGDGRRTLRAQSPLELRREAFLRRHAVAERRAAAEHDDAPLVRALRADDRAAIAPAIQSDAACVVMTQQAVGHAEHRDGHDQREHHGDAGEGDALSSGETLHPGILVGRWFADCNSWKVQAVQSDREGSFTWPSRRLPSQSHRARANASRTRSSGS